MRASLLRDRIELLKITKEKLHGELINSSTSKYIRCYVHKSNGFKSTDHSEIISNSNLAITVRNHFTISNEDRFKYNGGEYQIEHKVHSHDRLWLQIKLKKVNT